MEFKDGAWLHSMPIGKVIEEKIEELEVKVFKIMPLERQNKALQQEINQYLYARKPNSELEEAIKDDKVGIGYEMNKLKQDILKEAHQQQTAHSSEIYTDALIRLLKEYAMCELISKYTYLVRNTGVTDVVTKAVRQSKIKACQDKIAANEKKIAELSFGSDPNLIGAQLDEWKNIAEQCGLPVNRGGYILRDSDLDKRRLKIYNELGYGDLPKWHFVFQYYDGNTEKRLNYFPGYGFDSKTDVKEE